MTEKREKSKYAELGVDAGKKSVRKTFVFIILMGIYFLQKKCFKD